MSAATCNNGHPFSDFCNSACVWTSPADQPTIYTDADRTLLLTVWPDGTHELAMRDEHRRWLPPVVLERESLAVSS